MNMSEVVLFWGAITMAVTGILTKKVSFVSGALVLMWFGFSMLETFK